MEIHAQVAELIYKVIGKSKDYYLIEINLITGRHHQIRAQLAHIGCPIRGDLKYGYNRSNQDGSIHLHSRSISLIHPVKQTPLEVVAPTPPDALWSHFENQFNTSGS